MDLEPWCQNPQILHHWFEVERLTDSRRFVLLTVRFSKVDPCLKKQKQKTIREQKYLSWAPVSVRGTPAAPSLRGYRRSQRNSLPSTLVRVSTGLLQADSGATLAECFFMMMSSDGQSSEPLRLHPWGWFGADTRPLDGTLDVSRAGVLLSVPSHPSNLLFLIFFSLPLPSLPLSLYLCRIPPPPSSTSLPRSAVSSACGLSFTYSLEIAAIRQRHAVISFITTSHRPSTHHPSSWNSAFLPHSQQPRSLRDKAKSAWEWVDAVADPEMCVKTLGYKWPVWQIWWDQYSLSGRLVWVYLVYKNCNYSSWL